MVGLSHLSKATTGSQTPSSSGKVATLSWMLAMSGLIGSSQASPLSQQWRRDATLTYPGEHISWTQCGNVTGHLMECAAIDVPIDQFDTENSGNKTFNIPMVRMRGKNSTNDSKSILYNPGGPGLSGIGAMYSVGPLLMAIVGEDLNIISFDPRGVNSSTPSASCYATTEMRTILSIGMPFTDLRTDAPSMGSWASNFAKSCADVTGEHGKYINTPQVAADMNSILDAIGQQEMYYWGQSYGTLLGQTYANLFPNRSARIVIDGVVNQFEWYNSALPWMDYQDTNRVFWGFFDECTKAGEDVCPLASLSKDPDELNRTTEAFADGLKLDQIPVYVDKTNYGVVTYPYLRFNGIFGSLYNHLSWQPLASILYAALTGDVTPAYEAWGAGDTVEDAFSNSNTDEAVFFYRLNDGVSGKDYWPQNNSGMIQELEPFYNGNPFMYAANTIYWAKARWAIPKTHNFVPDDKVKTAHPVLVMSNTWDPVCSLKSAQVARETFEDSRLVAVDGYGHTTFTMGSDCANTYLRNYFKDGTLPAEDVTCEFDQSKYFPLPSKAE